MRLRAIRLDNVRRFTSPVEIRDLGDGINVLSEPNESGKSTLFDAIQALFFKPHGSGDKEVKALRPHAGGGPQVTVEVETAEGVFAITKRWLTKPVATVHHDGRLLFQADAAEDWIQRTLGQDAAGPSGLVWVRQGMTALDQGSTKELKAALSARRDLMGLVGDEVQAMTGGRRMDEALARCEAELAVFATGTGRVRTGGPWKTAQDAVAALTATHDELARITAELHDDLTRRNRVRRQLAELTGAESTVERQARLAEAQAAHDTAQRHAERTEALARQVEMARLTADGARSRLEALRAALDEGGEARRLADAAKLNAAQARAAHDAAARSEAKARTAQADAGAALDRADTDRRRADRAAAARTGADKRTALEMRIAEAQAARARMEAAHARILGPDDATLREIEGRAADLTAARAAHFARATQVVVTYGDSATGRVRLNGTALDSAAPLPLTSDTRLELDGIGTMEIRPAARDGADPIAAATAALRNALEPHGLDSVEAARAVNTERRDAERARGEAQAVLNSIAPFGLEALQIELAALPRLDEGEDAPDLVSAMAAFDAAREVEKSARDTLAVTTERAARARTEMTRADTLLAQLNDRLARADTAVAAALRGVDAPEGDADAAAEALQISAQQAATALAKAQADHADTLRHAPDLSLAEAALARARSIETQARDQIDHLRPELARLDERIRRASGDAVEERLAETRETLATTEADLARIEHEVRVLTRLKEALTHARSEARERYFDPVARELRPLLNLLWPEAELTWAEDSLLPSDLIRDGQTETLDILSGGTQEQIALLVRLAFARMLAAAGRPAPVILDDALVFTDDDRIERMFNALHRQAADLQIIVLTCRQRAFRDLGGRILRLSPALETATAAGRLTN